MVGSITLLCAVLSLQSSAGPASQGLAGSPHPEPRGHLSWIDASTLAARIHAERGVEAEPILGMAHERPEPLAIVPVGGHARAEVRTALAFWRMAAAARRDGVELQVSSGFRSQHEQAVLFDLYRRGRGPLASRPGRSNHQSGHALDLETRSPQVRKWLKRHAEDFGFLRTVPSERWHFEYWGRGE